jgi:hypothetical protein
LVVNGIDSEAFETPARSLGGFSFVYVGTLHEFQIADVELFLESLARARQLEPALATSLVYLAGYRSNRIEARLRERARRLGLESGLISAGMLPRPDATAVVKGAGVLLLFAGSNHFTRLSKLSDYAAAQRPIIALAAANSETARCVRELDQSVYSGSSADALAELIVQVFRQNRARPPTDSTFPFPFPHPLNWQTGAKQLAELLDRLVPPLQERGEPKAP